MYISQIHTTPPDTYENETERLIYSFLTENGIPFERVDTDEAVEMEKCVEIGNTLGCEIVKTICLTNRQLTSFYIFVTAADKHFTAKIFGAELGVSRVSFAPEEYLEIKLGTTVGATTALSAVSPLASDVRYVFDSEILSREWFGCTDGRSNGYMKLRTSDIIEKIIPMTGHAVEIINM